MSTWEGVNAIIKIAPLTLATLQCLQQFQDFMELEEKDLTQSKDTSKKKLPWHTYEAILSCKMKINGIDEEDAKNALVEWLLRTDVEDYKIEKFYLKNEDGWA